MSRVPVVCRGRDLPDVLPRLEAERTALVSIGRPVCPACRLVPASLAAIAEARPDLALAIVDMEGPEDWAVREEVLWPRGMRVSPASVPALFLLVDGALAASRQGAGPAHIIDAWIAATLGPPRRPVPEGLTDEEEQALAAVASRRAQHLLARDG